MRTLQRITGTQPTDLSGADKTGVDGQFVTGTSGTDGNLIQWNSDGDAVDSGVAASSKSAEAIAFGANLTTAGNFAIASGTADTADASSGTTTKFPVVAGTINRMIFLHAGDLSSNNATMKIHVNGAVQSTLTATAGANSAEVFTSIGVSVSDADLVEIEFDAGSTNPGNSILTVLIE